MNTLWFVIYAMVGVLCQAVPVFSQDAILPQGDPRLRDHQERERRLSQQGQGSDYRVEGKPQGGAKAPTAGDPNGPSRQDTGLADPSVNPGQASGMRVLRGEVKQATLKSVVIEDRNGRQATMSIDPSTAGDRDIRPGDIITSTVTAQGRAVAIHKERSAQTDQDISMSTEGKGGGHGDISPQQAGKNKGEARR